MKADFAIQVDPFRNLVRITLSGFFAPADIARFVAAREAASGLLRCGANQHVTLVDIQAMDIQSQDAVGHFQSTLNDPSMASKRLAIVLASKSLCRLQARRAAADRDVRYFNTIDDAEAYLLDARSIAA